MVSPMRQRTELGARAILLGGAAAAGVAFLRDKYLRWGASGEEVNARFPGDDLMPDANLTATRAVTVRAAIGDVWPWIAQLGQRRGGFYSYDFLENLVGCDMHSTNARRRAPRPVVSALKGLATPSAPLQPWARLVSNQRPLACEAMGGIAGSPGVCRRPASISVGVDWPRLGVRPSPRA
jgi:hypothetical protein